MTRSTFLKSLFLAPLAAVAGKEAVDGIPVAVEAPEIFVGFSQTHPYTSGTPVWFVKSLEDIEYGRVYDMDTVMEVEFIESRKHEPREPMEKVFKELGI